MGPVNWLMNKEGANEADTSGRRTTAPQQEYELYNPVRTAEEMFIGGLPNMPMSGMTLPPTSVPYGNRIVNTDKISNMPELAMGGLPSSTPIAAPTAQNVSNKPWLDELTDRTNQLKREQSASRASAARALGVPVSDPDSETRQPSSQAPSSTSEAEAARADENTGIQGIGNFLGNAAGMIGSFLGGRAPQQQQPAKPAPAARPPAKPNAAPVAGAKPTDSAKTQDWRDPYVNAPNDRLDTAIKSTDDDMGANLVSKENNTPRGTQARVMNDAWNEADKEPEMTGLARNRYDSLNKADKVAPPQIEKRTQTNANAERAAGTPFRQPRMQP